MLAHALTPILNVSNLAASFEWFEKFGWKKLRAFLLLGFLPLVMLQVATGICVRRRNDFIRVAIRRLFTPILGFLAAQRSIARFRSLRPCFPLIRYSGLAIA